MFSINLLPAYEQQAVRREEARRLLVFFSLLMLAVFGAGFAVLAPSFLLTRLAVEDLERSLALEEAAAQRGRIDETIARVRQMSATIRDVRGYAVDASRASAILQGFLSPGPGVAVLSFTLASDGLVSIAGHAATRGDLLRFEQGLRASQRFYEITFPLTNIVRERDIQFSVRGTLKPEHGL